MLYQLSYIPTLHTQSHTHTDRLSLLCTNTHIYTHGCTHATVHPSWHLTIILSQSMTEGRWWAMVRTVQSRNLALRMCWIWSFNLQHEPVFLNLVIQPAMGISYPESGHSTCNWYQLFWVWSLNLQWVSVILNLVIQRASHISYPESGLSTSVDTIYPESVIQPAMGISYPEVFLSLVIQPAIGISYPESGHSTHNEYQLSWVWSFNQQVVLVILSLVI